MDGTAGIGLDSLTNADLRVPLRLLLGALRGVPVDLGQADSAVPKCSSTDVTRLLSTINTEWLPSDVAWDPRRPFVGLSRSTQGS